MFLKFSAQRTQAAYEPPKVKTLGRPTDSSFESFMARVRGRMEAGRREYGDKSFSEAPARLVVEIMEELEDVTGWSYILWTRLEKLKSELEKMEG